VVIVRNGLDLAPFVEAGHQRGKATDGPLRRLGMVARLEPDKDHRTLIRAMARVVAKVPDARLILAGDGSLRSKLESWIHTEGIQDHVELPGMAERPAAIYRQLDIYVQTSAASGEGTSNSIIEAMATALPVVATDRGGNREVVQHGVTGLLVPAGDPGALFTALLSLIQDPARVLQMGEAGRAEAIARYERRTMIDATVAVYECLIRNGVRLPPSL
jgi:glycosyltransferase involved in cell wall biosynthesis